MIYITCMQYYQQLVTFGRHFYIQQEAQLSQRDRAAACLNYGKNISAKSVHLGYFFKVQWQQCRARTI